MQRLKVTSPDEVQAALRQEGARSPQSRFVHRLHCLLLVGKGQSCCEVARVFGDDPRSVERWVHEFHSHGIDGLREKPHSGRHAKLSNLQMEELALAVDSPPHELGYAAIAWTNKLLRWEIERRFGVMLSVRHSQRMLISLRPSMPCAAA